MTVRERVEAALRDAAIPGRVASVAQVAPIVSPMCRAADWTCLQVRTEADACFVKLREPDAASFVASADAVAAARQAAALGLAPALRFAGPGVMVFDLLQPPWREARLGDLAQPSVLESVLAAKRRMRRGPALARNWDVFEQIEAMATGLANPPTDLPELRQAVTRIKDALAASGTDRLPCHADGTVSNIMVHPNGGVRLVDFDCAGMTDPYYDTGIVLNEACASDADWHAGMEAAWGRATPGELARCRLYGIADDLLWGLWGMSQHAASERLALEFLKYGAWRLLRCRMALRRSEHSDVLRQV